MAKQIHIFMEDTLEAKLMAIQLKLGIKNKEQVIRRLIDDRYQNLKRQK